MPTLSCPTCGQTVRFEGVAGICQSCASVVMVPKSAEAAPPPPAPVPKTGRPAVDVLQALAGDDAEIFEPAGETRPKLAGMDPGVAITLVAVAAVLVLFAMYVLIHSMGSGAAGGGPVTKAPAPPPSMLSEPEPLATAVPTPDLLPTQPTSKPATQPAPPAWTLLRPVRPPPPAAALVTDARVARSIERAVTYLISHMHGGRLDNNGYYWAGRDALCVYALLHASEAIHDTELSLGGPLIGEMLTQLKQLQFTDREQTYCYALRAAALALYNRPEDRRALGDDVQWLFKSADKGAYGYGPGGAVGDSWDNSNSQYGMLGVWAAADAGLPVPASYWDSIESHWLSCQRSDGGWAYSPNQPDSTMTMTAAGITTLTVAGEQRTLVATARHRDPRPMLTRAISNGLSWMDQGDRSVDLTRQGYAMYGMERAALASGFKYFGQHDWYREMAGTAIGSQKPDGSWAGIYDPTIETSFRLLFLSRGRQPLLMNKLRFTGAWNNRPRDLAKLSQFCAERLEQPFAWGVVDLSRDWWDWLDAPVLMISTDQPPPMRDDTAKKFRAYADNGGLIFVHSEFQAPEMDIFVDELARHAFPEFKLHPLKPDDLLLNSAVPLAKPPPVQVIDNGDRDLLVYSPTDITRQWVTRRAKQVDPSSQFGLDLFVYAAGKDGFRHRLENSYVPLPAVAALGSMPVARLQYPGAWDPEPAAWTRFSRWFENETSVAVDLHVVGFGQLDPNRLPVAVLTGDRPVEFSKLDLAPLRKYVDGGGVLFIDACGGSPDFAKSVREQLLPAAFGDVQAESLDATAPVLAGAGDCMDPLPKPAMRQSAIVRLGGIPAQVDAIHAGKGVVLISDLDVTAGLLNTGTLSIVGYTPAYCQSLMKNVLLWTVSRYTPQPIR